MSSSVDESLAKIISEEDFRKLLQREIQGLLRIRNFLQGLSGAPTMKRFYSCLMEEARELKNFLDDFDARNNQRYAYLTELVLSLVSFSAVGYLVRHVLMRYPRYHLRDDRDHFIEYHKMAEEVLSGCHGAILRLFDAVHRECVEELEIRIPEDRVDEASFTDPLPRMHLPHTVDDADEKVESGEAPMVATMFLQLADQFEHLVVSSDLEPGAIVEFLAEQCTEDHLRRWEAQIYVVQRKYDTVIKGSPIEGREDRVRALRGHISMVLHHFEMVRYQSHFLEHLREGIRCRLSAGKLGEVIEWDALVRQLYEFSFGKALHYIKQGRELAKEILGKYTNVLERELEVPGDVVLHARPASLIVGIVNYHGTPVSLRVEGETCDASSMIQVMMTVGRHSEARAVTFLGDEKPLDHLELLFRHRLGEGGLDGLPSELEYLRG